MRPSPGAASSSAQTRLLRQLALGGVALSGDALGPLPVRLAALDADVVTALEARLLARAWPAGGAPSAELLRCSICLAAFGASAAVILDSCGHIYHRACIETLAALSEERADAGAGVRCALCRRPRCRTAATRLPAAAARHAAAVRVQALVRGLLARHRFGRLRGRLYARGGGSPAPRLAYLARAAADASELAAGGGAGLRLVLEEFDESLRVSRTLTAAAAVLERGGGGGSAGTCADVLALATHLRSCHSRADAAAADEAAAAAARHRAAAAPAPARRRSFSLPAHTLQLIRHPSPPAPLPRLPQPAESQPLSAAEWRAALAVAGGRGAWADACCVCLAPLLSGASPAALGALQPCTCTAACNLSLSSCGHAAHARCLDSLEAFVMAGGGLRRCPTCRAVGYQRLLVCGLGITGDAGEGGGGVAGAGEGRGDR